MPQADGGLFDDNGKPVWKGLALVRDDRLIRDLKPGISEVWLNDVPEG